MITTIEDENEVAAPKLTEVARLAGVSLATASRVINGSDRTPSEASVAKVRAAAEALGYVANAQAQALARSTSGLIGLVVHDIADPYFSSITRGAQRYARDHGSQVLLAGAQRDERAELDAVAAFVSYRTDAIVLAGSRRKQPDEVLDHDLGRYIDNGGRVLTLGRSTIAGSRFIDIGNREGARQLATTLIQRGISKFAILSGPPELNTVRDRVAGFHEALSAAKLTPLAVVDGGFDSQGGFDSALACWERLGSPRASAGSDLEHPTRRKDQSREAVCLLAVNDVMALGAITALRSLGMTVPNDVFQVAGFDDIPPLRDYAPLLTTYRLPLELIGEKAIELALSAEPTDSLQIHGEVVIRDSAG